MAVSISLSITQNSQSISNNTSNVTVAVKASWTYGSYNLIEKSGWVKINGTKYNFNSAFNTGKTTSGTTTLYTKTINIEHNDNGSKTLYCSASYTSGVASGTVTASSSKALTNIPRKSILSVSSGTLNTAQTLTITEKSDGFRHKIGYTCGTAAGWILGTGDSASTILTTSWTPPISLARQNTTGTSVSIKFTLYTYTSGGILLGSNVYTKSFTIPSSVKPTCSLSVTDPTGYKDTYGYYIKGQSQFNIKVTAATAYGSSISKYNVTANGSTYSTSEVTTGLLKNSGTLTISAKVTDNRSKSGTASLTVNNVLNYTSPIIRDLKVRRCNLDGTENNKGSYVKVTFSTEVTALNNLNTANYLIKYKKTNETDFTENPLTDLDNIYSLTDKDYIFEADTGSAYDIELSVADNFSTTTEPTNVSTAFTLLHFGADGTSLGVGGIVSESNLFDVSMNAKFNGAVSGKVLGLGALPIIPNNSDFNSYVEEGVYAVQLNTNATTMKNIPCRVAGKLIVENLTGFNDEYSGYKYFRQTYKPYSIANATYERDVIKSSGGVWSYGDWAAVSPLCIPVAISGTPTGSSYTCSYYPFMNICFLRMYLTGLSMNANTIYKVGTVVDASYLPNARYALSTYTLQDYSYHSKAAISTDGNIQYMGNIAKEAVDDQYITGFWFVN